jgi:hypothetical protein
MRPDQGAAPGKSFAAASLNVKSFLFSPRLRQLSHVRLPCTFCIFSVFREKYTGKRVKIQESDSVRKKPGTPKLSENRQKNAAGTPYMCRQQYSPVLSLYSSILFFYILYNVRTGPTLLISYLILMR